MKLTLLGAVVIVAAALIVLTLIARSRADNGPQSA